MSITQSSHVTPRPLLWSRRVYFSDLCPLLAHSQSQCFHIAYACFWNSNGSKCSSSLKKTLPSVEGIALVTITNIKIAKLNKLNKWARYMYITYLILLVRVGDLEWLAFGDQKHTVYIVWGSHSWCLRSWIISSRASGCSRARRTSYCWHDFFLGVICLSATSSRTTFFHSCTSPRVVTICLTLVLCCHDKWWDVWHAERATSICR